MKKPVTCLAVIFLIGLGAIAAQVQGRPLLKATIPFDFTIADRPFNSGTYYVAAMDGCAQLWRATDGSASSITPRAIRLFDPNRDADVYKLIFNRYGSEYVLSEVWAGNVGYRFQPTRHEVQLAKGVQPEKQAIEIGK